MNHKACIIISYTRRYSEARFGVLHYLFDACALLSLLNDEEGAEIIIELLDRSERNEITVGINAVNLIEVYYDRIRVVGSAEADSIIQEIYNTFPITVIDTLNHEIAREAAHLKAEGKMSFADTILIATACCTGATVVTCDHAELEPIEKHKHLPFLWIRR